MPIYIYMPCTYSDTLLRAATTKPEEYASAVVHEVTKSAPSAWFWYGAQTFTVRWCDAFLPRTFWVCTRFTLFSKMAVLSLTKIFYFALTGLAIYKDV